LWSDKFWEDACEVSSLFLYNDTEKSDE